MEEILEKWNRWGSNPLESGIKRQIVSVIEKYLYKKEVIVIQGPRRAGKSTIFYQLMDILEKEKIKKEAILHINFEEPKLTPHLNKNIIDELYNWYREHIYPEGKAYIFLDEIQNVPEWERWVRARNKTENIKIFLTGSSAKLMSREIATVLTGRHLSFEIMPLNFNEFLSFKKISLPKHFKHITPSPKIKREINIYKKWGGFPSVTLAEFDQYKSILLTEYFDDILYKDVALRHNIRDLTLLKNIAIHLLTQTGKLISFQRISNIFQVSSDLANNYCNYLKECYLVDFLPYYSLKTSVRQRHPKKIYAIDLGIRNIVSFTSSEDEGRLIETLVYQTLKRRFGDNIFYWSGKNEIDFIIKEKNKITQLWQVVSDGLDEEDIWKRETRAFEEAKKHFPDAKMFLVTKSLPKKQKKLNVEIVPLFVLLSQA
jgi:predicted AAA+ superfamily ATPase